MILLELELLLLLTVKAIVANALRARAPTIFAPPQLYKNNIRAFMEQVIKGHSLSKDLEDAPVDQGHPSKTPITISSELLQEKIRKLTKIDHRTTHGKGVGPRDKPMPATKPPQKFPCHAKQLYQVLKRTIYGRGTKCPCYLHHLLASGPGV